MTVWHKQYIRFPTKVFFLGCNSLREKCPYSGFSGPCFLAFWLNTDQNKFEYGHFSRSDWFLKNYVWQQYSFCTLSHPMNIPFLQHFSASLCQWNKFQINFPVLTKLLQYCSQKFATSKPFSSIFKIKFNFSVTDAHKQSILLFLFMQQHETWRCKKPNPASNYTFKVNNRNTRTRCEICSKLTRKTPERCRWRGSGVFMFNFEHILHLALVFLLLLFEQANTGWKPLLDLIWTSLR